MLTNGGAEAIALVAALEPVGAVVDPEFSLYRRHLREVRPDAPRWRSNPSNPFGTLAAATDTARVWDEAFYPLATGEWSRDDAGTWRLGSLTKLWACPGLRIGYLIAPDATQLQRRGQPAVLVRRGAGAGVVEALAPVADPGSWAATIRRLRRDLVTALEARGIDVDDTDACWVLVHRSGLRAELALHGVLVRDCASFGLPGVVRVAVPSDDDRPRLLSCPRRGRRMTRRLRPLMVLGCTSRRGQEPARHRPVPLVRRQGVDVVPFKAQNMSNNARVVAGGEIGVAQWLQAVAARRRAGGAHEPGAAQARGRRPQPGRRRRGGAAELTAMPWRDRGADSLWPAIARRFDELRGRARLVVIEGAGSPAEINLPDTRQQCACARTPTPLRCSSPTSTAAAPSPISTAHGRWCPTPPRSGSPGFVLNKFRGDASLLAPGPATSPR